MATVQVDGRNLMRHMTIEVDTSHLHRQVFGIGGWRLWLARRLIGLAAAVLRCNVRIEEMTCIVGVVHEGKVYIGGDSAGVSGLDLRVRADQKVFRNRDMLIGFTSSFRMGQLLRYAFVPPLRHPDQDVYAYMVTTFIDAVRASLKTGGYAKQENGEETGGCFLVGYAGRLFMVADDYQVAETVDAYGAAGCGQAFALGSLYATADQLPEQRIKIALEAAERHSAGVRGPFVVEVL